MMDIERLLHKFYEGVSTPEEERLLTEYFLNEKHVDERWKEEQQLFCRLHDEQIQVPAGVSKRLEETIMQMESSEKSLPRKRTLYYWISSVAAVALVVIGLFFMNRPPSVTSQMADTFTDPQEAAYAAEQILASVSAQLNKGLDKAADSSMEFDKINQLINKYLN